MKQKAILTSLTTLALMAGSAAASASTTNTFNSTNSAQVLVTELAGYNGSINYTKANSDTSLHGNILSAYLNFNLSDDASSSLPAVVDTSREWAKFTTAFTDGSHSLTAPTGSLEVQILPITGIDILNGQGISNPTTAQQIAATFAASRMTALGFENVLGNSSANSAANYWSLDVTSLLQASNSGTLGFGLGVDAKYADIPYYTPGTTNVNPDWTLVNTVLLGSVPNSTIPLAEDYFLNHATLDVTYAPVPVPGAVWLFGSALAGLIGFRRKSV